MWEKEAIYHHFNIQIDCVITIGNYLPLQLTGLDNHLSLIFESLATVMHNNSSPFHLNCQHILYMYIYIYNILHTLTSVLYFDFQLTPRRGNGRSKGKGTNDPIRFLPVLPSKRSKPVWQQNQPNFELSGKILGDDKNGIDLVGELTASKFYNVSLYIKSLIFLSILIMYNIF